LKSSKHSRLAEKRNMTKLTRKEFYRINRQIRKQLRRAKMSKAERTVRRAILRFRQGNISLAAKAVAK
jgi:hypothetical protein